MSKLIFPDPPEEPLASDCCNSGCSPCVLDVYKDLVIQWEKQCEDIKEGRVLQNTDIKPVLFLSSTKYTPFRLKNVNEMTCDSNQYTFQAVIKRDTIEDGENQGFDEVKQKLVIESTQYLILRRNPDEEKSETITRAYTPISCNISGGGTFDVVIKLYPDGEMSQYIKQLAVGDVTWWRGPYGGLHYASNSFKRILMICAGTGIAPMFSLIKKITSDEIEETRIRLIYCCRDINNIILRKEIHAMQAYWNFSAVIYLSQQVPCECKVYYGEVIKTARLREEDVNLEVAADVQNTLVLICGTTQFCNDVEKYVKQCGVPSENVHIF